MQELIKGSLKQIIVDGDIRIDNKIHKTVKAKETEQPHKKNREADFELDFDEELSETGEPKEREPEREREHEPVPAFVTAPEPEYATIALSDLEALREHFRREGEEQAQDIKRKAEIELAHAKEDAEKIRQQAENERLEKLRALEAETASALEKAKKEGYDTGYGEGLQKGTDDGYVQGLKKCKETLLDLKGVCESAEQEKAALMAENRRGIFDMAMAIAEKITVAAFTQKDKQVLEKMISEAAKEFRSAKSVRVTLSKLDLSEDVEADLKILEKCLSNTANVEFEVLEDAESGTLLVETDSEILDAGVSTQLRMIEELGKGKFRDREPDEDEAEDLSEVLKAERLKKAKKPAKAAEDAAPEAVEAAPAAEAAADMAAEEAAAAPVEEAAEEAAAEITEEITEKKQEATEEQ